jgi:hypothetical protein
VNGGWPFDKAETHALIGMIFLNRYAVMLYAMGAPILMCSWIARALRGHVGRPFCSCMIFVGAVFMLRTGLKLWDGWFDNWLVFGFCLGLSLFSHGIDLFSDAQAAPKPPQAPDMAPSHDTHSAGWATRQEVDQAWGGRRLNPDEEVVPD